MSLTKVRAIVKTFIVCKNFVINAQFCTFRLATTNCLLLDPLSAAVHRKDIQRPTVVLHFILPNYLYNTFVPFYGRSLQSAPRLTPTSVRLQTSRRSTSDGEANLFDSVVSVLQAEIR